MSRKIVADPVKLETAAQKIDAQVADYERQYRQLFSEVDNMGAAWQGADNVAFVTQIKGFTDDFQGMVAMLRQYAEFLRASARTYRETQNETINAAKRLIN